LNTRAIAREFQRAIRISVLVAVPKRGVCYMKKKLALKKDTLRDLAIPDLKRVVGASDTSNPTDTCFAPTDLCGAGSGMCDTMYM